nr:uncharacterized protein LOC128705907 [Cherax quadricarinatus]
MVSDDVPVAIIKSRLKSANNTVEGKHWQEALQSLLQKRIQASLLMVRLVWELTKDSMMAAKIATTEHIHGITRWGCYDDCVKAFHTHCFDLAQVSLPPLYYGSDKYENSFWSCEGDSSHSWC